LSSRPTQALSRAAAEMAQAYRLRARDAIHLASAHLVAAGEPAGATFACWDARLWDAASRVGFRMVPHTRPG
jgi:predicted nucleic acid-binding protein